MGLNEDFERSRRRQQDQPLKKQLQAQAEARHQALCQEVPSLRHWYGDPNRWGYHSYSAICRFTQIPLPAPEVQDVIQEFLQVCPASAWRSPSREWGLQKCLLSDGSPHAFPILTAGDEPFRFGDQRQVKLHRIEPTGSGGEDSHYGYDLYIFRDGTAYDTLGYASSSSCPLSSARALRNHLRFQLDRYAGLGRFW